MLFALLGLAAAQPLRCECAEGRQGCWQGTCSTAIAEGYKANLDSSGCDDRCEFISWRGRVTGQISMWDAEPGCPSGWHAVMDKGECASAAEYLNGKAGTRGGPYTNQISVPMEKADHI